MQHVHVSTVTAITVFLMVIVVGALWRWLSHRLVLSDHPTLEALGSAMAFAY